VSALQLIQNTIVCAPDGLRDQLRSRLESGKHFHERTDIASKLRELEGDVPFALLDVLLGSVSTEATWAQSIVARALRGVRHD
jgi:hypothetical protein